MSSSPQLSPSSSIADVSEGASDVESLVASVGEPLLTDYRVHELPDIEDTQLYSLSFSEKEVLNRALLARVEYFEAENQKLRAKHNQSTSDLKMSQTMILIRFYTGLPSYEVFLAVFDFLGPAVNKLHYWGTKASQSGKHNLKLDPKNQFF